VEEVTKADRDDARFLPVEAECAWAFQVDYTALEELTTCMEMIADYGCSLVVYTPGAHQVAFAVKDRNGRSQSVMHLDWIVFTGGEVRTMSNEGFSKDYRRMKKEEK